MADDEAGKTDGEGKTGTDEFDPKTLSTEAQEFIRREVQSESDSKSGKATALLEKRLRDEQATRNRTAVEDAEQKELLALADSGQNEALGLRVAARLTQRSAEETAIGRASDIIEAQIANQFSESLGPEKVEEIRQKVVQEKGAHAEFAKALADATGSKTQAETIQAEVKAALLQAGVKVRDDAGTSDQAGKSGQGNPPSTFEEIEQAYTEGRVTREAYETAKKAR